MGCQCGKSTTVEVPQAPVPGKAKAVPHDVILKKVAQAKNTRVLALRECGLKAIPEAALGPEAANLRTIDLASNQLKALPPSIAQWSSLQSLSCGNNAITELPASIQSLVSLQKLTLSSNKLSTLPVGISMLKVKVIELDQNLLGPKLPEEIFSGPVSDSLEELVLTNNRLEELPLSVGALSKLVRLLVSKNRLTVLPAHLGQLSKLQHLDAAENSITCVPEAIIACPSLNELWLKGNPIERLHLQAMPGFEDFLERRKQRLDARIGSNVVGRVDLSVCGLD